MNLRDLAPPSLERCSLICFALWTHNCITEISASKELEAFWCMDFVYHVRQGELAGRGKTLVVAEVN